MKLHNQYIGEKRYKIHSRPAVLSSNDICLSSDKACILTTLHQAYTVQNQTTGSYCEYKREFKGHLKCTADLSEDEINKFTALYSQRLQLRNNSDESAVKSYMSETFPKDRSKNTFIEYFTEQDKVISFLSFSVKDTEYPGVGPFVFFWGKLAAIATEYGALGLNTFVFRLPYAIKYANTNLQVIGHYKSIRPGYSYNLVDSNSSHLYPKFHHDTGFMRFIARLTGEEMIETGLAVAVNKIPDTIPLTPVLEDFEELAGTNLEHGVLLTWNVTPDCIQGFLKKKLQGSQFDDEKLLRTGSLWSELYQNHCELRDENKSSITAKL